MLALDLDDGGRVLHLPDAANSSRSVILRMIVDNRVPGRPVAATLLLFAVAAPVSHLDVFLVGHRNDGAWLLQLVHYFRLARLGEQIGTATLALPCRLHVGALSGRRHHEVAILDQALGLEMVVQLGRLNLGLLLKLLLRHWVRLEAVLLLLRLPSLVDRLDHRRVDMEGVRLVAELLGLEDLRTYLLFVLIVEVVGVGTVGRRVLGEQELHHLLVNERVGFLVLRGIELPEAVGGRAFLRRFAIGILPRMLGRREELGGGYEAFDARSCGSASRCRSCCHSPLTGLVQSHPHGRVTRLLTPISGRGVLRASDARLRHLLASLGSRGCCATASVGIFGRLSHLHVVLLVHHDVRVAAQLVRRGSDSD